MGSVAHHAAPGGARVPPNRRPRGAGQIVAKAHENAREELSEEVRKLRIELCETHTTLNELRSVIASDKARVVDLPSPLRRVI